MKIKSSFLETVTYFVVESNGKKFNVENYIDSEGRRAWLIDPIDNYEYPSELIANEMIELCESKLATIHATPLPEFSLN